MRKESSNQFTEGLVCDLNPINTPNTVLTDALNATIITYDGNEYSLQNDRGNYPLENCRLKPNYIPVGLKEYGDILYIVSFNPLDNSVEIGTYPSPLNVESSKENNTDLEIESVIETISESENYSSLIEKCKLHIWTSDNEEDSKLYPGDEYKIKEQEKSPYKYEALEYFIIDENRKKYNITDLVKTDNEWHPTAWQIPGWLSAQYRIGTFDDFIMSVRSISAPTLGNGPFDCKVNLNFQFRISDYLFLPKTVNNKSNENDIKSDIGIKIKFSNGKEETIYLNKGKFINWYSDSKILWIDTTVELKELYFGQNIKITATPFVEITVNNITKRIDYDSFEETYNIYLNSIGSYEDFTFGNDIWKFYIDEDDNESLYIEYDVTGPNVTKNEVQLYYRVLDIDGETELKTWDLVNNYAGITPQGIGTLSFNERFEKEAIYVLEFAFYEAGVDLKEISDLHTIKKLVIASQIFSDFVGEYSNFNDIDFDSWIRKYNKSIISDNINTSHSQIEYSDEVYQNYNWVDGKLINVVTKKDVFEEDDLINLWDKNYKNNDKGWFTSKRADIVSKESLEFIAGHRGKEQLTMSHNMSPLVGPLWDGTPKVDVQINPYIESGEIKIVSKTRRDLKNNPEIESIVDVIYGKKKSFTYESSSQEFTQIHGLKKVDKIPLMWLYNWADQDGVNERSHSHLRVGGYLDMNSNVVPQKPTLRETVLHARRSDVNMPNDITRGILSALGDNDFGILGVLIDPTNTNYVFLSLTQGSESLAWKYATTAQILFTYLVFKQSENNKNYAILVPISNPNLWNKNVGEYTSKSVSDWWHEGMSSTFEILHQLMLEFTSNLQISTQPNAINKGKIIRIITDGAETDVPICNVKIKTNSFEKWFYGKTDIDLLNFNSRNKLVEKLGKGVCGNLLYGSVTKLPEILFNTFVIEKSDSDTNSFNNIDDTIRLLNNNIKTPNEPNQTLINALSGKSDTKGVFWLRSKEPTLISTLNRSYSGNKLLLNTTDLVQLYTTVGLVGNDGGADKINSDNDKLYLGWVANNDAVDI